MDVEDVEALLVDDASQNQATAMAGELVSCSLAALTSPCIIAITRQNSYLNELFILNFAVTELSIFQLQGLELTGSFDARC